SNRENVLQAIELFRNSLDEFESHLQNENYLFLEKSLKQSQTAYQEVVNR
ncbi:MAG: hypothetical protein JNJ43_19130, partial [Anaerolineales bacterium]|nr:hypothetical protein [Anaerolineales bacterium]